MTCIVVNDERLARNAIKALIDQTESLTLLALFNNIFEASRFITKNTVDLVFFDIQIDETRGYDFIKSISSKTFIIFISEFSTTAINAYKPDIINLKSYRFQKGVNMAQEYLKLKKRENSTVTDDYFVI